jgi:hypothetical protein
MCAMVYLICQIEALLLIKQLDLYDPNGVAPGSLALYVTTVKAAYGIVRQ